MSAVSLAPQISLVVEVARRGAVSTTLCIVGFATNRDRSRETTARDGGRISIEEDVPCYSESSSDWSASGS